MLINELKQKYSKLLWSIGLGEMAVSLTSVIDMVAVGLLGVSSLAGYTLADGFISALYLCYDAVNTFIYAEYSKSKDTKLLSIATKLGLMSQFITILFILCILLFITKISGLSVQANNVAFIVVVGRSIGSLFFQMTVPYYVYYRSEGKEKIATTSRLIVSVINISLDVLAIVFKLGITGIIAATVISEISEYVFLRVYSLRYKLKFIKSTFKETLSYVKYMASGYGVTLISHGQLIVTGLVASYLGDELYALYGIIQVICNQFMWFVYSNDMIVEILYGEFISKYNDFKLFCKDIFRVAFKPACAYTLFTFILTPVLIKLLTYDNGLTVSLFWMFWLNFFWVLVETYLSICNGLLYILEKYKLKIIVEVFSLVINTVMIYLFTYTKNPYYTYFYGWLFGYLVMLGIEYRVIKNKSYVEKVNKN